MKLGIISDIHGNLAALEAALNALTQLEVEQFLCLGDVALFGPQPAECLARLKQLPCQFVMGNTDERILVPGPIPGDDEFIQKVNTVDAWGAALVSADDKSFIASFQPALEISLPGETTMLAYHGSPKSFNDLILPDTSTETLNSYFEEAGHSLFAGGHVHTQFMRPYRKGLLFNPGSIGLPRQNLPGSDRIINPCYAEFAIVDNSSPYPSLNFYRVPYPIEQLKQAVYESEMPEKEWWLADWQEVL